MARLSSLRLCPPKPIVLQVHSGLHNQVPLSQGYLNQSPKMFPMMVPTSNHLLLFRTIPFKAVNSLDTIIFTPNHSITTKAASILIPPILFRVRFYLVYLHKEKKSFRA